VDGTYVYVAVHAERTIVRVPAAGGDPEVLVRTESGYAICVDDEALYWTRPENASEPAALMKMKKGESHPAVVLVTPQPGWLTVDGNWLYFTQGARLIRRVPKQGGVPSTVVRNKRCNLGWIALDAKSLFWTCTDPGVTLYHAAKPADRP
jgi:hypothetical protein